MDMLRFDQFTIGYAWRSDFGSADASEKQFRTLRAYSPVRDRTPGKCDCSFSTKKKGSLRRNRLPVHKRPLLERAIPSPVEASTSRTGNRGLKMACDGVVNVVSQLSPSYVD